MKNSPGPPGPASRGRFVFVSSETTRRRKSITPCQLAPGPSPRRPRRFFEGKTDLTVSGLSRARIANSRRGCI